MSASGSAPLADTAERTLRPLSRARNLAWWEANVEATDENQGRLASAELAYSEALADEELFAAVEAALEDDADPPVRRRLELLRSLMLPHQVPASLRERVIELEASVEVHFARHRGVVRGKEVDDIEIRKILRESDDPEERQDAWQASKTVGAAVADAVRELARLRNEAARSLGHRDWCALSLEISEMDEGKLLRTLAEAERATAEPFSRWKATLDARLADRFRCEASALRPWHYADPFFQESPPEGAVDLDPLFRDRDVVSLARRTFEGIGIEVGKILERSDLFPRAGKNQHAFCLDVDRDGDVRVLANVTDNHDSMNVMLHELGHGIYDLGYEEVLPWLLRDTHLVATEASALLFGALATDGEWLEHVLEVDRGESAALGERLRAARAAELLVFTRWVLVMTSFERLLYGDPEGDLDSLWWELVARHQLLTPPEGRRSPDWAAKIHVAVAPVYYHNYLYGAVAALQIRDALRDAAGGLVERPEAGELLAERLFAPGASIRWDRLIERVTASPLSIESLAREVGAA